MPMGTGVPVAAEWLMTDKVTGVKKNIGPPVVLGSDKEALSAWKDEAVFPEEVNIMASKVVTVLTVTESTEDARQQDERKGESRH